MTEGRGFEAIVLAAGTGSRFGGGKLLAPYAGGALIEGALAAAFAAPVRRVVLVTGADADRLAETARAIADRTGQGWRLNIVHAADYSEGMGASLRTGAAALSPDAAGVFVLLGDMPRIPHGIFAPLVAALEGGAKAAAPVFQGQRGHPALIGAALIPQLLTRRGDAGARAILKDLGPALALVEAPDDGVLFDVDERDDLDLGGKK